MDSVIVAGNQFLPVVTDYIRNAVKSIDIAVFDWRWFPLRGGSPAEAFNIEIQGAAKKGVKVRVVSQQRDLVIHLNGAGIHARRPTTGSLLHTKLIIIDNQFVVVGSHNYTNAAFSKNHELSVLFEPAGGATEYTKYFEELYTL